MRATDYGKQVIEQLLDTLDKLEKTEAKYEKKLSDQKSNYEKKIEKANEEIAGLKEEIRSLQKLLKTQNEQIAQQNKKIDDLLEVITKLTSNNNNNSNNSSNPPSSDQKGGKAANEHNGRQKSGKKPGGQKGHAGKTLTVKDIKEKIASGELEHRIVGEGEGSYISKYVLDLEIKPIVTEYRYYPDAAGNYNIPEDQRSDVTYGHCTRALAVLLYSEGVIANDRLCNIINGMSNGRLTISEGSIYNICRDFSRRLGKYLVDMEEYLMMQPLVHTDGTVVTNNGKLQVIRNFSTAEAVLYRAFAGKTLEELKNDSFLNRYAGILVHDHETTMYHFGTRHAECNVHILRYLRKNTEDTSHSWSTEMQDLLLEMKKKKEEGSLTDEIIAELERRYDDLLDKGYSENIGFRPVWARDNEKKLLNRLKKYKTNHLLFLHSSIVPFENNMSERDLRKCKNRQKISGGFRKLSGSCMYADILSFIESCKKQKKALFESVLAVYRDNFAFCWTENELSF